MRLRSPCSSGLPNLVPIIGWHHCNHLAPVFDSVEVILNGVRVIEGSAFVAAPTAGMTLAQLGAHVVRFDAPGGSLDWKRWPLTSSGDSLFWSGRQRGKRSIEIDLRSDEGREQLSQLITMPGAGNGTA